MPGTPVPFNKNVATTESLKHAHDALGDISIICGAKERITSPSEVANLVAVTIAKLKAKDD